MQYHVHTLHLHHHTHKNTWSWKHTDSLYHYHVTHKRNTNTPLHTNQGIVQVRIHCTVLYINMHPINFEHTHGCTHTHAHHRGLTNIMCTYKHVHMCTLTSNKHMHVLPCYHTQPNVLRSCPHTYHTDTLHFVAHKYDALVRTHTHANHLPVISAITWPIIAIIPWLPYHDWLAAFTPNIYIPPSCSQHSPTNANAQHYHT